MKRRSFLQKSALVTGAASLAIPATASQFAGEEKNLIEWRVYHISRSPDAKNILEKYFSEALIPFFSKRNIKCRVFHDYGLEEPVKVYVLIAYPNIQYYSNIQQDLSDDPDYLNAVRSYSAIAADKAVYSRYETFMLSAFDGFPQVAKYNGEENLFELRLYESASEDAGRRKIAMFNKEEIPLFLKTGLTPVFFGQIMAGQFMPGLLYMLGFKDMTERDAAWDRFAKSEEWKVMQNKPEYADTVSNIHRTFLTPASFLQL